MGLQARFGQGPPPLTIGVEEELVVLDATTLEQVGEGPALVAALERRELPGRAKTELHASVFELNTDPCATAAEALESLRALRHAAAETAAELGLTIAATGAHPLSTAEAQPIVQEERYLTMVAHHGPSARRQNVQGLHVHVAVPSGDECWRLLEAVLPWLPGVLALSANSPWFDGELTGMASSRAPVLAELPRTGAPPAFGSYAAWEAWVDRMVRLGIMADYTRIWWDIRPHPSLGTLEIRMPDQPTDVRRSAAFAELLQKLCGRMLGASDLVEADRADFQYNRWAASRFGPAAELITPGGGRVAAAADIGRELLELTGVEGIDPAHCEGELQLRFEDPYEVTAEMMEPGQGNFIPRDSLMHMLKDHPEVAVRIAQQLSRNYFTAYEEIRTLGLTASPSEKFAKLLLSWSTKTAQSDGSAQVKLTLTHEEVAEIIGTTRETVSRLFSEFKKKQLMQLKGATLVIRSRMALEKIVQS